MNVKHLAQGSAHSKSSLHNIYYYQVPHFPSGECEAPKGEVSCPQLQS